MQCSKSIVNSMAARQGQAPSRIASRSGMEHRLSEPSMSPIGQPSQRLLFFATFLTGVCHPNLPGGCRDAIWRSALSAFGLYASRAVLNGDRFLLQCFLHQQSLRALLVLTSYAFACYTECPTCGRACRQTFAAAHPKQPVGIHVKRFHSSPASGSFR